MIPLFQFELKILLQLLDSCSLIVFVVKEEWRCVYLQYTWPSGANKHTSGLYIDPILNTHSPLNTHSVCFR